MDTSTAGKPAASINATRTILVVEDMPSVRSYYKFILEKEGFRCEEACDGQEALDKIRACTIDLVVLDLVIPKVTGEAVLQSIRSTAAHAMLPVLVISTEPAEAKFRRAATATTGPVGYAQKPLMPRIILEEVQHLLA